ncbi:MAG: DUF6115 domain-containing protein [Eubacteriales bacterium]
MEIMEIVIVIVGIGLYGITFLIPEKKNPTDALNQKLIEDAVEKKVEQEYQAFRGRVEEIIDETMSYASEKTERLMERLSNEKIQHVDEFSTTVLKEIHKNHEETMFLYDMLVQKQKSIKTMTLSSYRMEALAEAAAVAEDSESGTLPPVPEFKGQTAIDRIGVGGVSQVKPPVPSKPVVEQPKSPVVQEKKVENNVDRNLEKVESTTEQVTSTPAKKLLDSFMPPNVTKENEDTLEVPEASIDEKKPSNEVEEPNNEPTDERKQPSSQEAEMDSRMEAFKTGKSENYNLRILELYKEGLDEREIAKELGRGVGEVKLVIGLFKEV